MSKAMNFHQMTDLSVLYRAHMKARLGHRHKGEVIRYDLKLLPNLVKLQEKLRKGKFSTIRYYHFKVFEPKTRDIYATNYETRIVLHALCDEVLVPLLGNRLIYDNAACQKGKGTHFALRRFTQFLVAHFRKFGQSGYALKCDIHKYFDSIDHALLKVKLSRVIKDPEIIRLLSVIIDSYATPNMPGKGLPLGNQTSQWFAIFYLDTLDRYLKEVKQFQHYGRYMDDFILLHPDKAVLRQTWCEIETFLVQEKLTLNPKTQIFKLKTGVTYLGFRFSLGPTGQVRRRMRGQSKVRMARRLKYVLGKYDVGALSFEQVQSTLMSYQGHLKYKATYQLRRRINAKFLGIKHRHMLVLRRQKRGDA